VGSRAASCRSARNTARYVEWKIIGPREIRDVAFSTTRSAADARQLAARLFADVSASLGESIA